MTTPDILNTVGFEKSKIGSGEKEQGYQIKESTLSSLLGSVVLIFGIMGFMVVFMVYDIHFEKKTLNRQMRVEEHHAASKLAQVQMELWSQYHDDIKESHEAQALLNGLDTSYSTFKGNFQGAVNELAVEFQLNPVKAQKYADRILHMVADMHQLNVNHTKHLIDHLIAVGKKSVKLEKHVEKQVIKEVKAEKKAEEADIASGIALEAPTERLAGSKGDDTEEDPLRGILEGFFDTFQDYESEFHGKPREAMKPGEKVHDSVMALYEKVKSDKPPSEEDVQEELDKIDLAGIGAGLGQGRVLPIMDIVEELALIPKIPTEQLVQLEKEWRDGKEDSVAIFEQLSELHESGIIPSGWLQQGVSEEEKEEGDEEEKLESE